MRISRTTTPTGFFGLVFEPTGYDASLGRQSASLDLGQTSIAPDRALVASALLMCGSSSTDFQMDQHVSATTASAVSRFLAPETTTISPISFQQQPFPAGLVTMDLYDGPPNEPISSIESDTGTWRVHVLLDDQSAGSLMIGNLLVTSANMPGSLSQNDRSRRLLAAGVLLAQELNVGTIRPHFPCDADVYRDLLVSSGLALMPAASPVTH